MTSSLVGSEMCIRDSSIPRRWGATAMPRGSCSPVSKLRLGRISILFFFNCLLYTSDAADDM
eukprot:8192090-Prorocentrum_lima.AAC.1